MVLCEILDASNFVALWAFLTVSGAALVMGISSAAFAKLYVNPSFELWRWKTNPAFPPAELVKEEILASLKGVVVVTLAPAATLYLARHGYSKAYCGVDDEHDVLSTLVQFFVVWLASDFYEFFYHYLGHSFEYLWSHHRAHHKFFNPSPFAVIADEPFDQFFRALPLLVMPMFMEVNIDLLFGQWAFVFYLYGTFIHTGYETPYLSVHQPFINTSYHHHLHHRLSTKLKPYHTGFFFQAWDKLFGSVYTDKCFCCECQHAEGKRTLKEFKQVQVPDYSVLLDPAFWLNK